MDTSEVSINGIAKEGFWLFGFFIVLQEDKAYYLDNDMIWRFLPFKGD